MSRIERHALWGAAVAIAAAALAVPTRTDAAVIARVGVSVGLVAPGLAVAVGVPVGYCDADRLAWGRRTPAQVRVFVRFPYPHWVWRPVVRPFHRFDRHAGAWREERWERRDGWRRGEQREERWERHDRGEDRRERRHHDRHHR